MHKYFLCGLGRETSSHGYYKDSESGVIDRTAPCLLNNVRHDRPMLQGCGDYAAFGDAGNFWPRKKNSRKYDCFYPSIHGLENIANFYPNSTIILIHRQVDAWIQSAHVTWRPSIIRRMSDYCSNVPNYTKNRYWNKKKNYTAVNAWANYYTQHTESIRNFSKAHNLTYIEASLEDPNLAVLLESKIGISRQCWGHANSITERRERERQQEITERRERQAAKKKKKEAQVSERELVE
jgi:hypothetical protein